MGLYDTVKIGEREGQTKCWRNELHTFSLSDEVGRIDGFLSYNIAMREGGFVWVRDGLILGWQFEPAIGFPTFDKYGLEFTPTTRGELDEVIPDPYFFSSADDPKEVKFGSDVLPDDEVCACLHDTGERQTRLYERCQRCGAFMEADYIIEERDKLRLVAEAAGPALAQWLQGRADWNSGAGAMTSEERVLKTALEACGITIGLDKSGLRVVPVESLLDEDDLAIMAMDNDPTAEDLKVLGHCPHGVDLDREFCPQGCRV